MKYSIKCNFCNKKAEHEPTFDNGIAVYLISYVCDECKEKIALDEKESLNRFSNTYIGESEYLGESEYIGESERIEGSPVRGTPILSAVISELEKLKNIFLR